VGKRGLTVYFRRNLGGTLKAPLSDARRVGHTVIFTLADVTWTVLGSFVERCKSPPSACSNRPTGSTSSLRSTDPHRVPPARQRGEFGDLSAVYNRLRRWIAFRRLKHIFEVMTARPACECGRSGSRCAWSRLDSCQKSVRAVTVRHLLFVLS
jgi:hypothetical protein